MPLHDLGVAATFQRIVDALLAGSVDLAQSYVDRLNREGICYVLTEVVGADPDASVFGLAEQTRPGERGYLGWGAILVRPGSRWRTIYQAPHVQADAFTTDITLRAFVDDAQAGVALFAGTHRWANGVQGNADVAHTHANLFHLLTSHLAHQGQAHGIPLWFVQFHGAADRPSEPAITGANGAGTPCFDPSSPLVRISAAVNRAGYVDMGICGWLDQAHSKAHGQYVLRATSNVQGRLLEELGLRDNFMHFELAQQVRLAFRAGLNPGYQGTLSLLQAIRETLLHGPVSASVAGSETPG
jgi:hypothetical protein